MAILAAAMAVVPATAVAPATAAAMAVTPATAVAPLEAAVVVALDRAMAEASARTAQVISVQNNPAFVGLCLRELTEL